MLSKESFVNYKNWPLANGLHANPHRAALLVLG